MQKPTIITTAALFLSMLVGSSAALAETEVLEDALSNTADAVEEQALEAAESTEEAVEEVVEEAAEAVTDGEEGATAEEETPADTEATAPAMDAEAVSEKADAAPVASPDAAFGAGVEQESSIPKASDIREEIEGTSVKVYVNNPPSRYTLLKKIRSEVYVIDAKSEADAEVIAFKKLKAMAKELDADGLIEVKRSIIKDSIAQLETPVVTGSMLGMDIDSTAVPVDELMLSNYSMDKGMLSNRIIEKTFDRSEVSQKAIRFTGKAIKLMKK